MDSRSRIPNLNMTREFYREDAKNAKVSYLLVMASVASLAISLRKNS